MAAARPGPGPSSAKYAFVTVGASASFKPLIEEVVSAAFVAKLAALSFTHLVVQCGPDYDFFLAAAAAAAPPRDPPGGGLAVSGFAYKNDLFDDMELTTPHESPEEVRLPGLIITHAGSGSILDALDCNTSLVAVPNTSLMDNHQSEIAVEMERQGFLVQGKIGSLTDAVDKAVLHTTKKQWPPVPDPDSMWPGGLWDVMKSLLPERQPGDAPVDEAAVEDGHKEHVA
ncbi:glycosyltransferase family 1 protein [Hypoxylon cercidicola]|nr:glycosyltransferase family 1 protein [Hypoxylon cercidicola]